MKDIQDFFQCCTSRATEPEMVVNMRPRKGTVGGEGPGRRTFIKRSVGRNPILDVTGNNTNRSTIYTPKQTLQTTAKVICESRENNSQGGVKEFALRKMEGNGSGGQYGGGSGRGARDRVEYDAQLADGIGFCGQIRNCSRNRQHQRQNGTFPQVLDQQGRRIAFPRNPYDQRGANSRQNEGNIHPQHLGPQSVGYLMHTMKSILQTIEQKQSIPSISQSQMNEMLQESSKATIKSTLNEKNQNKSMEIAFAHKYGSVVVERKMQALKIANSEDPLRVQQSQNGETVEDAIHRLQREKKELEEELGALSAQQKNLVHEKMVKVQVLRDQFANLDKIGEYYRQKLRVCQSQLTQIKKIFNQYTSNHAL